MSALRDEIRAILREELAALRAEDGPVVETVRIGSSGDLNRFVADLIARAEEPDFSARLKAGQIRFELAATPSYAARAIVSSAPRPTGPTLDKKLVTETDIAALGPGTLRLAKHSRLTPLARDEARRKGIRIERIET
ncbi:hypothetical protein [Notoacmeibacter marinus]|uniref:hypothetical protein n=1 Tax=Notoacmeibacter marinus TaxID=1876515 RepID=UPI000DF1DC3E|nr:hypothetical protein [Notoacmeibacter marinus]